MTESIAALISEDRKIRRRWKMIAAERSLEVGRPSFAGVYCRKRKDVWRVEWIAYLRVEPPKTLKWFGFKTGEEAARFRDTKARELGVKVKRFNFPEVAR
jgi:hypothetical protein